MKKTPPKRLSPRRLLLYSKPKAGKSTVISYLDNCLVLDLERGTDFLDVMSVPIEDLTDLRKYGDAIIAANYPYKYIAIDTVTKLEELCLPYALKLYQETPMGKAFSGDNVLSLPQGAGYYWLREAFHKVLSYIETLSPNLIMVGHLLDRVVDVKGKEVSAADIDLTGKLKRIACQDSDAIAYLYREGKDTFLNFNSSDTITCGARPEHLRGKQILIASSDDNGKVIETHWNKIFID